MSYPDEEFDRKDLQDAEDDRQLEILDAMLEEEST